MSRQKHKRPMRKKTACLDNLLPDIQAKDKRFEWFILAVLFCFGLYHSILYFGHQVVPNPDFTGFVRTGRQILSLQTPSSFKRAPVLGILQVCLSHIVGGQHPDLTAGWLLNAILHPFNIVLLYLVGKRILGKAAVWVAVIAILNPWIIQLLCQPIAETTLLFFILLTFFFILRRSKWCYLFASITTMVRYEGAALILAAFVIDMIYEKSWRRRIRSFVFSAVASIPLMLWMLGTVLSFRGEGSTHYLKELGAAGAFKNTLFKYFQLIWQVGFYPLFIPPPASGKEAGEMILSLSKFFVGAGFVFGTIYGLLKRRWEILALIIFLVPYILIHVLHSFALPRFCSTVAWIVMLICLYGLQGIWALINKGNRVPKPIVIVMQVSILLLSVIWLAQLVPYLSKVAPMSRISVSMPYVAVGVAALLFAAKRFVFRLKYLWSDAAIVALVCLMVISNQLLLARIVGNGKRDIEFKMLAEWYSEKAQPGEKMVSTMSNIVSIFAPRHKESFVHSGQMKADNPREFAEKCYEQDITYITWDSRMGYDVGGRYYTLYRLDNIAPLAKPRSIGPYEFVTHIRANKRRFINVFRLKNPEGGAGREPPDK